MHFFFFLDWTDTSLSNPQLVVYHRHNPLSTTNRYCQETVPIDTREKLIETKARHTLPQVPLNSSNKTAVLNRHVQNNSNINDNEDLLPIDNGQFSTNINYVQQLQRKSNYSTEVIAFSFC
jgi:hypothetical protein